MFLYILRELLKLAESRFGWALFAGTQNNLSPHWYGILWPREWPFIKWKHIKLGKPDTQERYPRKGEGTLAIP